MKTRNPIENVKQAEDTYNRFQGGYLVAVFNNGWEETDSNAAMYRESVDLEGKRDDYIAAMQDVIEEFSILSQHNYSTEKAANEIEKAISAMWEKYCLADDLANMALIYRLLINSEIYKNFMGRHHKQVQRYRREHQ